MSECVEFCFATSSIWPDIVREERCKPELSSFTHILLAIEVSTFSVASCEQLLFLNSDEQIRVPTAVKALSRSPWKIGSRAWAIITCKVMIACLTAIATRWSLCLMNFASVPHQTRSIFFEATLGFVSISNITSLGNYLCRVECFLKLPYLKLGDIECFHSVVSIMPSWGCSDSCVSIMSSIESLSLSLMLGWPPAMVLVVVIVT